VKPLFVNAKKIGNSIEYQLVIAPKFLFFYPDVGVEAVYQEVETTRQNFMMRVCSSILLSSLLLGATSVKAENLETKLPSLSQNRYALELSPTATVATQTFYSDSDKDNLPERGSGR
jgi:hypothetical protein